MISRLVAIVLAIGVSAQAPASNVVLITNRRIALAGNVLRADQAYFKRNEKGVLDRASEKYGGAPLPKHDAQHYRDGITNRRHRCRHRRRRLSDGRTKRRGTIAAAVITLWAVR